jgi:hypothetical protein
MPPSPRYTVRFPPALSDALEAAVRQGQTVSDIMRAALETYLASPQTLTPSDSVSGTASDASDTTRVLSDVLSDITDLRARLTQLEQQMEAVVASVRQRPTPPPPRAPDAPPRPPGTPYADARGTWRRQILALLHAHPEGLTPAEMRTRLGATKRLAQTCLGMLRDGLVRRVDRGKYAARPSPHHDA